MRTNHPAVDTAALPPSQRGTRGEILVELKQAVTGLTAQELAGRLGVSLNAVRHHLKELESATCVVRRREQRGMGAPVHVYALTLYGENLFPRRYEELLTEILPRLEGRGGRPAIVELIEERYAALADRLHKELVNATGPERLTRVARVLAEEGYMAVWKETDGAIKLTEHNCAIKAVAQRFPEICELEERFLRNVLAAGVERRSHILTGCQSCEYTIHFPESGPDGDSAALGGPRGGEK